MSDLDYRSIHTDLPPRYQIRRLEEKHIDWANSMVCHSNIFHSPVWPNIYPEGKGDRALALYEKAEYLIRHQVESGYSFGVFDLEYEYKRPESAATEGRLYWNPATGSKDETGNELLEQMDFPLVSIALAYDGINALDMEKLMPLIAILPAFADCYEGLALNDKRDPTSWKPTGPRQVLLRNATSSRHDFEGKGIMKKLAYFLMRYAYSLGFRGIQIECLHEKVNWVWNHPPAPFVGTTVSSFDTATYSKKAEDGTEIVPFKGSKIEKGTKVYVTLRPGNDVQPTKSDVEVPQVGAIG